MKKIAILATLFIFVACQKDPVVIPPDPLKVTVEVINDDPMAGSLNPLGTTEVVVGSNFTVSVTPNLGWDADSIVINNNKTKITSNSITFVVSQATKVRGIFYPNLLGYLSCFGSWTSVKFRAREFGTTEWYPQTWVSRGFKFTTSYQHEYYYNGTMAGGGPFLLIKDSLLIGVPNQQTPGGWRYKVERVTKDSLVMTMRVYPLIPGQSPVLDTEETYAHPK